MMNLNLPVLSHDEERILFKRYKQHECLVSAEKIVRHHLGLVNSIAFKLRHYNMPHEDLFQEGVIGLMKAVKSFDITRENRFVSYALVWIRSSMLDFIEKNISNVRRITSHAKSKLFYNLRKHLNYDSSLSPDEITKISEKYNVSEDEVKEMEIALYLPDESINSNLTDDPDSGTFADTFVGDTDNHYLTIRQGLDEYKILNECLGILTEREKSIIEMRYLTDSPKTREEISRKFGTSQQYIAQVENKAIKKMKELYTSIYN